MNGRAYIRGHERALAKYAGVSDVLRTVAESPNLRRNLNLAGLSLIAAPTLHSVMTNNDEESEKIKKLKHLSDLAGLGLLMGTEFMHH